MEDQIKNLAEAGILPDDIARYVGLTKETLMEKYGNIVIKSPMDRTMLVAQALYEMAVVERNVAAMSLWLKTVGKFDEIPKQKQEMTQAQALEAIEVRLLGMPDEDA